MAIWSSPVRASSSAPFICSRDRRTLGLRVPRLSPSSAPCERRLELGRAFRQTDPRSVHRVPMKHRAVVDGASEEGQASGCEESSQDHQASCEHSRGYCHRYHVISFLYRNRHLCTLHDCIPGIRSYGGGDREISFTKYGQVPARHMCGKVWGRGFTTIDWVLRVFSTATRHCCPWEIESSENRMLGNGWNGADS